VRIALVATTGYWRDQEINRFWPGHKALVSGLQLAINSIAANARIDWAKRRYEPKKGSFSACFDGDGANKKSPAP
jgi:hypothetical protein